MFMHNRGFTLIELMIVVAIVGILAAVALPAYQDYTARSQVTEAVTLTSQYKQSLAGFHSDYGDFSLAVFADMNGTSSGLYVDKIAFANAGGETITIVATFKSSGVASNLLNKTFSVDTLNGGETWHCGDEAVTAAANAVEIALLPQACK